LQQSSEFETADDSLPKNVTSGTAMMEVKDALAELRFTKETLRAQLLQRRTLPEIIASGDLLNQATYATTVIDTLDALDRIDNAIDILENESGDVLNRAILCLKTRSKNYRHHSGLSNLH
jgi:hypothetical protein